MSTGPKRADQHGFAFEHVGDGDEAIGLQRGAGRHEVADEARNAEPWGEFDRAAHGDDLGGQAVIGEELRQEPRVAGRDPLAVEQFQVEGAKRVWRGDLEAAAAEAEPGDFLDPRFGQAERIFLQHVLADDAKFAHSVRDERRNVVVAHEHQVEREVLGPRGELVLAALAEPQAGILEQLARAVRKTARLLHGHVQAVAIGAHDRAATRSSSMR